MKTATVKLTEDTLMVMPLNMEAIIAYVADLKKEENPNVTYKPMGKEAVVCDSNVVTDDECCYEILTKVLDGEEEVYAYSLPMYKHTKTETGTSFGIIPSFSVTFRLPELIEKFTLPAISLKEYMGGRFNYNARIERNTYNFLKDINSNN